MAFQGRGFYEDLQQKLNSGSIYNKNVQIDVNKLKKLLLSFMRNDKHRKIFAQRLNNIDPNVTFTMLRNILLKGLLPQLKMYIEHEFSEVDRTAEKNAEFQ